MIIGLENKIDNMKIEIMKIVIKQINSLKFQQKLAEEQSSLSIYCQKYRKKHLSRECRTNVKVVNTYVICAGKHSINECSSILGLKETFEEELAETSNKKC